MPIVKVKVGLEWFRLIESAAEQQGRTIEELVLDLVAAAHPPPVRRRQPIDDEPLIQAAQAMCLALDRTRTDLTRALLELRSQAKGRVTPAVVAKRRRIGARLRAAIRVRGWTQADLAARVGVSRSMISAVLTGRAGLPEAWTDRLDELLGEDWRMDSS
jgi:hypothetical protein